MVRQEISYKHSCFTQEESEKQVVLICAIIYSTFNSVQMFSLHSANMPQLYLVFNPK